MRTFLSIVVGLCFGVVLGVLFLYGVKYVKQNIQNDTAGKVEAKVTEQIAQVQNIFQKKDTDKNHYFIQPVESNNEGSSRVVYADLGAMKIMLYENGEQVSEYPIQSIGRERTAWQTPIGNFNINYKVANHFSSIGEVYMPWSMQFFGNYFIHGWPYYPDGTPVKEGYSGGCIRMETLDAKSVYDFIGTKTQLIVLNSENEITTPDEFEYSIKEIAPSLNSNFIIADVSTGEVLAANNQKTAIRDSSFSKLMTGIISLESVNQYKDVDFEGRIMQVSDVLYPLILADSDTAEEFLFDFKNKNWFLSDMNTRAKSIGMLNTTYENPAGEVFGSTTLEDTFRLIQYINHYKPFLIDVLNLTQYSKNEILIKSVYPLHDITGYVSGFSNKAETEAITIIRIEFATEKDSKIESGNPQKTFAILVAGDTPVVEDTRRLVEWVKKSVSLK